MSLRAILSGSRVKKRTAPANKQTAASPGARPPSEAWPGGLRQTKPHAGSRASGGLSKKRRRLSPPDGGDQANRETASGGESGGEDGAFSDDGYDDYKLDDAGFVASLADDLCLRDVVQALRYARANMFDPLPQPQRTAGVGGGGGGGGDGGGGGFVAAARGSHVDGGGHNDAGAPSGGPPRARGQGHVGNSTRVAELLAMRRRLPPLATTAHVAALLPSATATERETVALVRAGMLRKVVQPQWRRGFGLGSGGGGGDAGRSSGGNSGSSTSGGDSSGLLRRALAIGGEYLGEVLVETAELQKLVYEGPSAAGLGDATKAAFVAWLGRPSTAVDDGDDDDGNGPDGPAADMRRRAFSINGVPAPRLTVDMVDELVRAGFLVGHGATTGLLGSLDMTGHRSASAFASAGGGGGGASARGGRMERGSQSDTGDVYARPEDRTTLLSLANVARAASGSFAAVGGVDAVYAAGGGGARDGAAGKASPRQAALGRAAAAAAATEDLALAIPGHGLFTKIVSGALAYLIGMLVQTPYREALETSLRERWDAGGTIAKHGGAGAGLRDVRRVPLSRTKKWKDFYGLSFDWVLAEALGAGLVEIFSTGSVGKGVRLVL